MSKLKVSVLSIVSVAMIAATATSLAANKKKTIYPRGCHNTGFSYEYGYLVLRPGYEKQNRTLYLIGNNTPYNIELKTVKDPNDLFMPEYDRKIPKRKWAVFAMEKPELHFQCIHIQGKNKQQAVRCDNLFKICQYDNAKFPHASMGTYWLEKTGNLRQAMHIAIKSGILLRW